MAYSYEPFPILTTKRLVLRQVVENDAPEIFFQRSDARMLKYLGREPAKSIDEANTFIEMIQDLEKNGACITWARVCTKMR